MANEKISQLDPAAALDGTEPVPVVQGGETVRTTTQDIADLGGGAAAIIQAINVTTGASPVNIDLADYGDWIILVVMVTSGGTAGDEFINFIGPDWGVFNYDVPGESLANSTVGRSINVVFKDQTDPSDVIKIQQNSGGIITCIDNLGNSLGVFDTGILDEEGNNIVFGFNGDVIPQYRWNCIYGTWDNPTVISQIRRILPAGDGAYGQILSSQGGGSGPAWSTGPIVPLSVFSGGTVAALNSNYPAGSYPRGMAVVFDADTPVVGSVAVGGGTKQCVVISDSGADYLVMFIFP